jgi:hypothetical protein
MLLLQGCDGFQLAPLLIQASGEEAILININAVFADNGLWEGAGGVDLDPIQTKQPALVFRIRIRIRIGQCIRIRIRIRIQEGKMTHKNRKMFRISYFEG